ncbi:MAG: hypothetical protein IJN20_00985 [Oscillospiraceae bacterium]|nr:hypothetical protein [Oscillospiraceae bacterium]
MNRGRRMIANILSAFFIKGGSVLVGVFTIPAYMRFFSNESILGVWYTLLSLFTWVLNFDLGIGNGMRNMLVRAMAFDDKKEMREIVSSAYVGIGLLSGVFALVAFLLIPSINWNRILNVSTALISDTVLQQCVSIVFLGIIFQFFFKLITSVLNALERTAVTNLLPLISNTIVLLYVSVSSPLQDAGGIRSLSWVYTLAVSIPYILATIIVFRKSLRHTLPSFRYFSSAAAKRILSLGGQFFGIQLSLLVISVTNEILISNLYGAATVVTYQVYNKIFYTIATLFSLITNPVWSAVASAYCQQRIAWIRRTYHRLLLLSGLASLALLLVGAAFPLIVRIWLGSEAIAVSGRVLAAFIFYSVVLIFSYAESAIANGMNRIRPQMICYFIAAIAKIPLCLLLWRCGASWESIIAVNGLCLLPYVICQHVRIVSDFRQA